MKKFGLATAPLLVCSLFISLPLRAAEAGPWEMKICDGNAYHKNLVRDLDSIDRSAAPQLSLENIAEFKKILSTEGWPTYECAGVSGINLAGRLLYRSSKDYNFQLEVLRSIDSQVGVDVDPYYFANLWDAISLAHDGTQTYGTILATGLKNAVRPKGKLVNEDSRLFFRDFYGLPSFDEKELGAKDISSGFLQSGWTGHLGRPTPKYTEPQLREELGEMIALDQQARLKAIQAKGDGRKKLMEVVSSVDAENLKKIKKIFSKYGFPNVEMVGRDGVSTAFLLVQHADADPDFQAHALELAEPLMKSRQLAKQQFAYLVDRVRIGSGKKQLYGTQVSTKTGKAVPLPVEEPEKLDSLRASMNLGTEEGYLSNIEKRYLNK